MFNKRSLFWCLALGMAFSAQLWAEQSIPSVEDPMQVPMTFLEQERALVLEKLKNLKLEGNETVLHLGCRDGALSNEIAHYLPQGSLIGFENSYSKEAQACSNNVKFLQGKFTDQNWENLFDCIVCTQFDECGDDPNYCIPHIEKALKPGGYAIIFQCIEMALPVANPLEKWLQQPENQPYAEHLKFWSPVSFEKFRSLVTIKFTYPAGEYSVPLRMTACFKNEDAFRSDAKKWFRKIASLKPSDQDAALSQLFETMKNSNMLLLSENEYRNMYYFQYNLEAAYFRKHALKNHPVLGVRRN